jgi:very-short-patch-repair endonuclease
MPEILMHHADWTRIKGILVRRTRFLSTHDVTVVDGIVCTNLARTACDIAPDITNPQLVRVVDDIQRRGFSMGWLMYRADKLKRTGRQGPPLVLDIVRRRLGGYRVPESVFERMLAECLKSPLLSGIVRQHRLVDASGDFIARFDFAVPWARLGIEAHSRSYHLGELVERYDEDRDMRATKQGWETVYLGFAATRSPTPVRHDIEQIVQRRVHDLRLTNLNGTQLELLPQ